MTPAEIQRAVTQLRSERASSEQRRDEARATLTEALGVDPAFYDPTSTAFLRRQVAQLDANISNIDTRIALFEARLPTAETIRAGQAEADARLHRLPEIARRVTATTEAFIAAIAATKTTADDLLAARHDFVAEGHALRDLADRTGLTFHVPAVPTLAPAEAKRAWLLASFILATVFDGPDDTLLRDLAAVVADEIAAR